MLSSAFFRAFTLVIRRPIFFLPLLVVYLFKWLECIFLFYAVQWPFKVVFAPIISRFWGIMALHYPGHIFWMYTLLKSQGFFFDVFLSSIASYILILWIWNYLTNKKVKLKLIPLILYVVVSVVLYLIGQKAFPILFRHIVVFLKLKLSFRVFKVIFISAVVLFNTVLQSIFVYSCINLACTSEISSFWTGFKYLGRLFWPTVLIIVCACSIYMPVLYWQQKLLHSPLVINLPESVLIVSACSDLLTVVLNTILYSILVNWFYEVSYEKSL